MNSLYETRKEQILMFVKVPSIVLDAEPPDASYMCIKLEKNLSSLRILVELECAPLCFVEKEKVGCTHIIYMMVKINSFQAVVWINSFTFCD